MAANQGDELQPDVFHVQELFVLGGHSDVVRSCHFSANARQLCTTSDDKTCVVWDAVKGEKIARLVGHDGGVTCAQFSPDGRVLATSSKDSTCKLWCTSTWKELHTLRAHCGYVRACRWSPDGRLLATASDDKTCVLWEVETRKALGHFEHIDYVHDCAFSPRGDVLATASRDKTCKLWDLKELKHMHTLAGHTGFVWGCAFSQDGDVVLTASQDKSCKMWHVEQGVCVLTLSGHAGEVNACLYADNCHLVVTASDDATVRLWDYVTGKTMHALTDHGDWVTSCAFARAGALLASTSKDGTCRVYSVNALMPATVSVKGPEGAVEVGNELVIEADVTGQPPPEIVWSKDGAPLRGESSESLRVSGLDKWHAGEYACTATNQCGTATAKYTLIVTDYAECVETAEGEMLRLTQAVGRAEADIADAEDRIVEQTRQKRACVADAQAHAQELEDARVVLRAAQAKVDVLQGRADGLKERGEAADALRQDAEADRAKAVLARDSLALQQQKAAERHRGALKKLDAINAAMARIAVCTPGQAPAMLAQLSGEFGGVLKVQRAALARLHGVAVADPDASLALAEAEGVRTFLRSVAERFPLALGEQARAVETILFRLLPMVHEASAERDVVKLLTTPGYKEFRAVQRHVLELVSAAALPLLEEREASCAAAAEAGCAEVVAGYPTSGVSEACRGRLKRAAKILVQTTQVRAARATGDAGAVGRVLADGPAHSTLLACCLTLCDDGFAGRVRAAGRLREAEAAAERAARVASGHRQLARMAALALDLYHLAQWLEDQGHAGLFEAMLEQNISSLDKVADYVDAYVLTSSPFSLPEPEADALGEAVEALRAALGARPGGGAGDLTRAIPRGRSHAGERASSAPPPPRPSAAAPGGGAEGAPDPGPRRPVESWTVDEVVQFVARAGLPQYAKSFRHNMIDGHMLATLDAKDLMDLGVDNRFHRRRLALKIGLLTGGGDRDGGS
jgi:WD40 repeat protein